MPTIVGVTATLDGSPLVGRTVSVGSDTAVTDGSGLATIATTAVGPGNNVVCATPGGETATWTFSNASTGDSGSGSGFTAGPQVLGEKGGNSTTFTLLTSSPPPPPPPPPPPASSSPAPTGTVEVVVNRDGVPVPLCHLRLIAGSYEEVGVFADPSANPLAFTDVPVTTGADPTEGTIQVFCAYGLSGCEATFSAVWSGGSLADVPLDEFGFGSGFEVVEGGTTTVTVDIACTPTPSSPPPPPGCCPEVFWCAEGGGTVSHPVGPRPDGVVGRPKRNQSQAERECPPVVPPPVPPVVACTPECDVPGQVYVNFLDRTGGAVEDWPNSVLMEVETADANLVVLRGDASGGFWRRQVRMWFLCDGQVWLTFCGEDPAVTGLTNMASSTGWDYDISGPLAQCPATGTTVYHPASFGDCWADLGYPHEVGTFGFPASPDGTFRMVLTLP